MASDLEPPARAGPASDQRSQNAGGASCHQLQRHQTATRPPGGRAVADDAGRRAARPRGRRITADLAVVGDDHDGAHRRRPARAAARGSARRCGSRARRWVRRPAAPGCRWPAPGRWRPAAARHRRARAGKWSSRSPRPTLLEHRRAAAAPPGRRATSIAELHVLERGQAGEEVEGLEDEADGRRGGTRTELGAVGAGDVARRPP